MRTDCVIKHIIVLLILVLLTSCSAFSPIKTETSTTYVLNSVPTVKKHLNTRAMNLLVMPIESNSIYNTTQMIYTTQRYEVAHFAKNRWAAPPAQMLQPLIVQTLQNTRYFRAVSGMPAAGVYQLVLNTQLIELQQIFFSQKSVVRMTLRAQLINTITNQITTKEFSVTETAPQNTPYGGVVAANRATVKLLQQLVAFCVNEKR